MLIRRFVFAAFLLSAASIAQAQGRRDTTALAQTPPAGEQSPEGETAPSSGGAKWRTPGSAPRAAADGQQPLRAVSGDPSRTPIARVTKGPDSLPNDGGQEWRDYDISPYTARVTSTNRPEQAILDWILRETGYEAWHTQPLAVLNIDNHRLRVYHTPEMHGLVSEMVDRFVNTEAESHAFAMRVITVGSPNWRSKSHKVLHPVATQTQGVQAWLLAKEDAALLVADLRRRSDFQEHSTPHLLVNNGQAKHIAATRTRNYIRDVILKAEAWPGFEPQMAQFDEGFKLEFNPLLSLDGRVVDAVVRCEVDLVEKLIPVMIDVPTTVAPRQRQRVDVPQPIGSRLHERFRWPVEQVLMISLGVGPTPVAPSAPIGVNVPLIGGGTRTELLVLIESKGKVGNQATALQPGAAPNAYRNRY